MSEKDLQAQLEELKKQLQELVSRQDQDQPRHGESLGAATSPETGGPSTHSKEWLRGLTRHVGELLHEVKIDLNEVPAATAILLFAFGVIIGRMSSK